MSTVTVADLPLRAHTESRPTAGNAEPVRADIPSPRKITGWIMRPRATLTDHQEEQLLQVRLACADITRACDLARAFHNERSRFGQQ